MDLKKVLLVLDKLAPLRLAATWDNVGLLVEPSSPHIVNNVLLTNDLTESVMKEAIGMNANMIISYHPPIFKPLKRLAYEEWKDRLVIKALENRIAIYSPHTACDALQNGVNDWLCLGLGPVRTSEPIQPSYNMSMKMLKFTTNGDKTDSLKLLEKLRNKFRKVSVRDCDGVSEVEIISSGHDLNIAYLNLPLQYRSEAKLLDLSPTPLSNTGMGRICCLQNPTCLADVIDKIKSHLSLSKTRVAIREGGSVNDLVETVALCAGSGASLLRGVQADVYLTGEMSHHEILDAISNNTSVILCEHSNTERGFLHHYKDMFLKELNSPSIEVKVSEVDRDPIIIC